MEVDLSLLELSRLETSVELERRPTDLLLLAEEAIAEVVDQLSGQGPVSVPFSPRSRFPFFGFPAACPVLHPWPGRQ